MDYKAKLTLLRLTTGDLVIRRFLDALLDPPNPSSLRQATISSQKKIELVEEKAAYAQLSPYDYVDYMFMEEPERLTYLQKNMAKMALTLDISATNWVQLQLVKPHVTLCKSYVEDIAMRFRAVWNKRFMEHSNYLQTLQEKFEFLVNVPPEDFKEHKQFPLEMIEEEIPRLEDLQMMVEANDVKTFDNIDKEIVEQQNKDMIDIYIILNSLQVVAITSPSEIVPKLTKLKMALEHACD